MSDLEELIRRLVRDELAKQKPVNDPPPAYVTVAQYAAARSISESTVRQAIADRRLDSVLIGRARRIPVDAKIGKRAASADHPDGFTERARLVLLGGGKSR